MVPTSRCCTYAVCHDTSSFETRILNSTMSEVPARKLSTARSTLAVAPRSTRSQTFMSSLRSALSGCQYVAALPSTALVARPHEQSELRVTPMLNARLASWAPAVEAVSASPVRTVTTMHWAFMRRNTYMKLVINAGFKLSRCRLLPQHLVDESDGNRSFTDRGRHALDVAAANIADREETRATGLQQIGRSWQRPLRGHQILRRQVRSGLHESL